MTEPTEPVEHTSEDGGSDPPESSVLQRLEAGSGQALPRVSLPRDASTRLEPVGLPPAPPDAGAAVPGSRYRVLGELSRGGMGVVLHGHDVDLGREVAIKVLREDRAGDPGALTRFIEEAQIGGQLQHPGIVPVHELGLGSPGRQPYFSMRLVRGQTLDDLLRQRPGVETDRQHCLQIFLQVCQSMAYAHSRGVIHRDLKPHNIMLGSFGEVQVVDWGLAKVLVAEDLTEEAAARNPEIVRTVRSDPEAGPSLAGTIMGTPAYMPPEQAQGLVDQVDRRGDVFALGAILCEILTGSPPYHGVESGALVAAALGELEQGIERLHDSGADPALVDLTIRCLAVDPGDRPPDAGHVARRMATYLADVEARARQAQLEAAEARIREQEERKARREVEAARERAEAAQAREAEERTRAQAHLARFLRLADVKRLERLRAEAEELWPANPELIPALTMWLEVAADLTGRLPLHEAALAALRRKALDYDEATREWDRTSHPWASDLEVLQGQLAWVRDRLTKLQGGEDVTDEAGKPVSEAVLLRQRERLEEEEAELRSIVEERRTWRFATDDDSFMHDALLELVRSLRSFGQDDPTRRGTIGEVSARLEFALTIQERSVTGESARRAWEQCIEEVASHPAYGGLELEPQLGLLPLGPDPDSGLWELVHLQSGEIPLRDAEGRIQPGEGMGIVLVLVPGSPTWIGAQSTDPEQPLFDPRARHDEMPNRVLLAPYLLSKYPMTQGQWLRCTGENPSYFGAEMPTDGMITTLLHPVENVSWLECNRLLRQLELELPTEARWEHACRAGTTTPWSTGSEPDSLIGSVNMADQSYVREGGNPDMVKELPELDDGFPVHSPVGSFRANPWGFHDMHGNVWEWCLDWHGWYHQPVREGDGERLAPWGTQRVCRGGGWTSNASDCRAAIRNRYVPGFRMSYLGVRPARSLQQAPGGERPTGT